MIDPDSATALWACQLAHQTKAYHDLFGKHIFFCDNFYMRHTLASVLKKMTDGEARIIGTVRFTKVDATNQHYLKKAIKQLKDSVRGSWKLVRAFDKVENYDALCRAHASSQKKIPQNQ